MRNMKIKVENNLDEIVAELERFGCALNFQLTRNPTWVTVNVFSGVGFFSFEPSDSFFKLTTLAELKEMQ